MNFSQSIEDYLSSNNTSNYVNIKNNTCENISNSSPIIKIIEEKNKLIEQYQNTIKNQERKSKEQIDKLIKQLEESTKEIICLKAKLNSIKNNNTIELIEYYEKEIGKIILTYDKMLEQYKNNISILVCKDNNSKNNKESNHNEKLKRIIEILMKENGELKDKNEKLQKINRMNKNYSKINFEKNQEIKNYDNIQKIQITQLNSLLIENKRLKEQIDEDKKIILNLSNSFEYQNKNNGFLNSPQKPNTTRNTPKNKLFLYLENQNNIELNNNDLDKYLNSCKVLMNDKINFINSIINKILIKVEKENSIYKKIYIKYFDEIKEALITLLSENKLLIKKANNALNSSKISRQILNDLLNEYNTNIKNKQNKILSDESIEMTKKYLNLFK